MPEADYKAVLERLAQQGAKFQLEEKFPEPVFKEPPLFLQPKAEAQ